MKKADTIKDTLRPEYTAADFPAGFVRGKYASKAAISSNIVVLEPELAAAFPNSTAVNDALRAILQAARHIGAHP
ncbi:MAG: hypothetical protein LBP94_07540 [Zoogloeaceae bacterium]|jgi:hypothetical protein|nr:hypothetical protein [Zoogloeaceae bacterium]